ncbi:cytochrome c oxidase subunit 4 [Propionicicella superfundia]|uniref:cytochrome c oxidase subunit 4 n=1 Tax=Propionicicella superfundia TaxID=348582 RepID=UPI000420E781|nr:cytochrome c oxidase subunit 4 [Propionicicella superfundia]
MKAEGWIFGVLALFFVIVTPLYWVITHETIGLVVLLLTAALTIMITAYLFITARNMDPRPEDRTDGEIVEGAGELGFFPPSSIWPFWSALTVSIAALGPVFGWWLTLLGFGLGIWALCGWVYQFYVGEYSH